MIRFLLPLLVCCAALHAAPTERPNILWLTFEDTSASLLGCYGNRDVKTPNIDRLASEGIRFDRAWSNGVQCSPARSSLIFGRYATSLGTDFHRQNRRLPDGISGFPKFLKDAGYFTTNNAKTDYNAADFDMAATWSARGKTATYNDPARRPDQPFFSVFNADMTHMSRLTTITTDGRRDFAAGGLDPAKLALPPHVPDLPDVRSDYALHLEGVQDTDEWVGRFLADLEKRGLADNTIIFVFADHGGCLPRGKGFVFNTGLRVPFVVYLPPRWRGMAADAGLSPGRPSDRLIGFVDLAPTMLSLAGIPPESMPGLQGQAFLGPYATASPRPCNFGFTSNRDNNFSPARAVTDGDFLYIRNFIPRRPLALRNFFQWRMPSNLAWDAAGLSDSVDPVRAAPFQPTPPEQLFDLRTDPFNTTNLAGHPDSADRKATLAAALDDFLAKGPDIGFTPPGQRGNKDLVSKTKNPADIQAIALRASDPAPADAAFFAGKIAPSNRPEIRYWAASGLAELAVRSSLPSAPEALVAAATSDPDPETAAVANEALALLGGDHSAPAIARLVDQLAAGNKEAHAALEALSLDPARRPALEAAIPRLEFLASAKPRSLPAASILANLNANPSSLYSEDDREKGRAENRRRRPILPTP